jgi:hypothetical protein
MSIFPHAVLLGGPEKLTRNDSADYFGSLDVSNAIMSYLADIR